MDLNLRLWSASVAMAAVLFTCFHARASDYVLQPGDALAVTISGTPIASQRLLIGPDGKIAIPLFGELLAAGVTLQELKESALKQLPAKVYSRRGGDRFELAQSLLSPEDIDLTMAEYRPIYVQGDVSRPGEVAFRPGMRVRQALAVAGGFDVVRFRINNPVLASLDLASERQRLSFELIKETARLGRLKAELGQQSGKLTEGISEHPLTAEAIQNEAQQLRLRRDELQKDKETLQKSIAAAETQLETLAEKRRRDEEGSRADAAEYERVRDLFQRGMTPNVRLSEARRTLLLSSNQMLQTIVETFDISRKHADDLRKLEKLDQDRRLENLRHLQETSLRVNQLTEQVRAIDQKIAHFLPLQSVLSGSSAAPEITVFRDTGAGESRIQGDESTALRPGDTVVINLRIADGAPSPYAFVRPDIAGASVAHGDAR